MNHTVRINGFRMIGSALTLLYFELQIENIDIIYSEKCSFYSSIKMNKSLTNSRFY